MLHAINWSYLLKCIGIGLGTAAMFSLPLVMGYLWLICVI